MRLIDADAFKQRNERLLKCDFPYICEETLEELIDDAPTIEERKEGKWVDDGKPVDPDRDSCWCSVCGAWLVGSDEYRVDHNFCPNCGADMREEKTDEH